MRGTWGAGGGLEKEEGLGAAKEEAGRRIREACAMVCVGGGGEQTRGSGRWWVRATGFWQHEGRMRGSW